MKVYLDSSVVLRWLLHQANSLPQWGMWSEVYASTLLRVEILRTIDRLRLENIITDKMRAEITLQIEDLCKAMHFIPLGEHILERASQPFPTILGTLDALHLATALELRDRKKIHLTFLTHDAQLGMAAQSMNFTIQGI